MPIAKVIPENRVSSPNPIVKPAGGNKLFTARLTSAANAQEKVKAKPAVLRTITGFAWGGLKKIGAALQAAGNIVVDVLGIRRQGKINYLDTYDTALKIARFGVSRLSMEVWSLLKDEAFPILGAWLKLLHDNWHRMTPYGAFKGLIEAIRGNPRIKNLFNGVLAERRAS